MAIKKGFDKHEIDVVNGRLRTLYRVVEDQLPKVLKEVVEDIKKDVINSAPVQTGNLRNSVYTTSGPNSAKVEIDTTKTETRPSSRRFNYGHTVEHGRAGRYKTTNYWYDNVRRNLGKLDHKLKQMLAKAAINKK